MKECLELNIKAKREIAPIPSEDKNSKIYWVSLAQHFEAHEMPGMAKMCLGFAAKAPYD